MEVQLAVTGARNDGHHIVPNYLKPSTGSCHNACKYGGTQTLEAHQPPAKTPDDRFQKRRSLVPRKLFGRGGKHQGAVEDAAVKVKEKKKKKTKEAESSGVEEWKDIVAYDDDTVAASHGSSSSLPAEPDKQQQPSSAQLIMDDGGGAKRRQKESLDSKKLQATKPMMTTTRSKASAAEPTPTPTHKSLHTGTGGTKGVRPPRGGKKILPAVSVVAARKKAVVVDRELVDGYQPLSPSLLQNRASLLRDLEEEMMMVVREEDTASNNTSELKTAYDDSLDHIQEEEHAIAAAETSSSSRPVIIPAHRRAKSVSIGSRFALARQASRNSGTTTASSFKLRSKSSKGPTTTAIPTMPSQQEESKKKPARLRSRRGGSSSSLGGGGGDELESSSAGGSRGIQLRIRSLRRRGVGGSSGGTVGFVVPAVSLRHQKTLEKKRSQRLYNNVIEETASKLVKTRKSRVKALVGAFESVISKIAK